MAAPAPLSTMSVSPGDTLTVFVTGNAPYRENKHNTSRMIRDAVPSLISRPGKPDIVVLKYHRDSPDIYEDIRRMAEELWTARRSFFLRLALATKTKWLILLSVFTWG